MIFCKDCKYFKDILNPKCIEFNKTLKIWKVSKKEFIGQRISKPCPECYSNIDISKYKNYIKSVNYIVWVKEKNVLNVYNLLTKEEEKI